MNGSTTPAVWFPTIRAGSGTDVFTERLVEGLRRYNIRAEITWLPHHAEYAPWTVAKPKPPSWANITHINTWLSTRFFSKGMPIVATMHHCVHGSALAPYKHAAQSIYHHLWVKRLEKNVISRAEYLVAVSHFTAKATTEYFGRQDIEVIHNGIDLNAFTPDDYSTFHHPFRLLYVGNWSSRKGVELLAPIMRCLGSGFVLHYTAATPTAAAPDNMIHIGRPKNDELIRFYQESDALLFPSRLEGFGLSALEAQACGLPVIATRGSSLLEVIEDDVTGLLCPQDDIKAFATAARQFAENPELWYCMSHAARKRVETHFGLKAMVDSYVEIYRICL
jgi:glycosyltransferase involved in cell wall biosynthesis